MFDFFKEPMRDATKEELESVDKYIKSISKPTGTNFFALLENANLIQSLESKQLVKRGQRAKMHLLDDECIFDFRNGE